MKLLIAHIIMLPLYIAGLLFLVCLSPVFLVVWAFHTVSGDM